jgi:hypothetical protein
MSVDGRRKRGERTMLGITRRLDPSLLAYRGVRTWLSSVGRLPRCHGVRFWETNVAVRCCRTPGPRLTGGVVDFFKRHILATPEHVPNISRETGSCPKQETNLIALKGPWMLLIRSNITAGITFENVTRDCRAS